MSLTFFEDVFVPDYSLQHPSDFDVSEKQWCWRMDGEELCISVGDPVRLRVVDVKFRTICTPAQLKLKGEPANNAT